MSTANPSHTCVDRASCDLCTRFEVVYETAKELAQMWRDQRTAPFALLDRLAEHFKSGGGK